MEGGIHRIGAPAPPPGGAPTPCVGLTPARAVQWVQRELLLFLGAPAREEGLKARFEALTGQLAAAADAPGTAHKLCMTLRFIFFLVRLIKIDIANAPAHHPAVSCEITDFVISTNHPSA